MRTIFTVAAAGFMLAGALPVLASESDDVCGLPAGSHELSRDEIGAKMKEMGYEVRDVEDDDGCLEVRATDASGKNVTLMLNPGTGEPVEHEDAW